jgi:DNA-binding CsgD family transcriptional regulator
MDTALDETIAAIYQAGACTQPWGEAFARVNNDLGMLASQAIGVSKANGSIIYSDRAGGTSDGELAYIRQFHAVDPRVPVLLKRPAGIWLYDQDDLDVQQTHANALYNDLFLHMGVSSTATVKLFENEEELHLFGILSPTGGINFEPRHRQYLQSITYHLQQAAAMYQKSRQRVTQAFAGSELLQRMDRPAWLLYAQRGVSFANERAKTYLFEHNAFLLVRDRLAAQDRRTDEALDEAFKAIEHDIAAGLTPQRRVVRLATRPDGAGVNPALLANKSRGLAQHPAAGASTAAHARTTPSAAISLTAFVPSRSMFAFGTQVQILMIVHSTEDAAPPDLLLWEAVFDLTPAQSRVALELFQGRNVKQIANALQVAQTTVKSHLGELFAKTRTKRQPDLLLALAHLQAP